MATLITAQRAISVPIIVAAPLIFSPLHERWQGKWISAVLDTEYAQQEAVDKEQNATESDDSDLLGLSISNSWDLDSESDDTERQCAVWKGWLAKYAI